MSTHFQDLRITLRQLARRPGLAGFAVLSLALGIGASTTIFSIVNAFLLNGLEEPGTRPDRLIEVYSGKPGSLYGFSSYPNYLDLEKRAADVVSLLGARLTVQAIHVGEGANALLPGEAVSHDLLRLYGLEPVLGRDFRSDEPAGAAIVVLGHGFWQRRFGGDPEIVGRRIALNGQDLEIIGVAPPELRGAFPGFPTDFWVPIELYGALTGAPLLELRQAGALMLTGRLRDAVTLEQARARFEILAEGLRAEHPEANEDLRLTLAASHEVIFMPGVDDFFFQTARRLMMVVALVLVIACSNIANLLLTRAAERRHEIATRLALGSSRWRLVRTLVTEGVVLALPAGVLGLALAQAAAPLVVALQPVFPIPLTLDLEPDLRVFLFTFGVALLSGLVCALIPALRASRPRLVPALKGEGGEGAGGRFNVRNALCVAQVALSTVLLIGAGLFLRSFVHARSLDPGFTERHGVAARVALGVGQYGQGREAEIYRQLLEHVRTVPGVRSAALVEKLPLMPPGSGYRKRAIHPEEGESVRTLYTRVGPGYFETLGIAILQGRDVRASDVAGAPGVVIVNEAAGRRFWPGHNPLGQRLRLSEDGEWLEVVGVTRDGRYASLGESEPPPFVYLPQVQHPSSDMTLVVAGPGGPGAPGRLRDALRAFDPELPVYDFKTLAGHLDISLFLPRMGAGLLLVCGLLGLVLASAGLFGVVSYAVSRRTREVGIRMAVGARGLDVVGLIVRQGMGVVAAGVVLGLAVAWAASGMAEKLLYGIGARDPWTYLAAPLLLAVVALVAHLVPARRAARVEPTEALRSL